MGIGPVYIVLCVSSLSLSLSLTFYLLSMCSVFPLHSDSESEFATSDSVQVCFKRLEKEIVEKTHTIQPPSIVCFSHLHVIVVTFHCFCNTFECFIDILCLLHDTSYVLFDVVKGGKFCIDV
jgi:hypothetical protein